MSAIRAARAGLLALALLSGSVAWAHARLARSDPADGALLDTAPTAVHLWFDSQVEREFHRLELLPAEGKAEPVPLEAFVPDPADRARLSARLPPLASGAWRVRYEVVSRDGHRVEGSVRFRVR